MTYCETCTKPITDENELALVNIKGQPHYYHELCLNNSGIFIVGKDVTIYKLNFGTGTVAYSTVAFTKWK